MSAHLDHVVCICADLERGSAWFAARTGVEPRYGGLHSTGLTHNAILGLGAKCYLEILAPAGRSGLNDNEWARLARAAAEPSVLTYCLRVTRPLAELGRAMEVRGWKGTQLIDGGRAQPDGVQLCWQSLIPTVEPFGFAFPFFIDWLESPHPADLLYPVQAGAGLRLDSFAVGHPQAGALAQRLAQLRCPIDTYLAPATQFRLRLATPRGAVELATQSSQ